jgi:hypothetical protein
MVVAPAASFAGIPPPSDAVVAPAAIFGSFVVVRHKLGVPVGARRPCPAAVISGRDASAWRAETPARRGRVRLREEEDDRLDVGQCPRPSEAASGDAWDDEDQAKPSQ